MESLSVTQTEFDLDSLSVRRRELWNLWAQDINEMDDMMEVRVTLCMLCSLCDWVCDASM